MQNNWQHNARNTLKGASRCNDFFQSDQFEDQHFPIKIPLEFANLIDKNNPDDPLLKQVINAQARLGNSEFSLSPLDDESNAPVEGLIHKYPNRVLLITSRVCAIHCQYCFRQNFDYSGHDAMSNWLAIEDYIRSHQSVNEVILSGGDPLSLSDEKLEKLIKNIENIKHVKLLRIHSRSVVVTPSRITDKLVKILSKTALKVVLVTHINHENEISEAFIKNIGNFDNVTLLNQSVLLAGVNDDSNTLERLSLKLFDVGILPYYLHMLDKVKGAEHFLVSDEYATQLHQNLKKNLSGYLVPKLVRDENLAAKTWV
ncbi:MAG: KamA family radical SAM protein [Candidatus Thioglobus sp.]|uniref:KamA family radical SAM protein n=1 Tax=Candidatus Thioglobus sp. TaxID=2026721 RepID=UPI001EBEAFFE|nr:KamA family radical SAM protein [Candidatus Thioglobus sp.]MBT3186062.1 KamA family radical SAM protein [Candidatus Thioglobus sp.]